MPHALAEIATAITVIASAAAPAEVPPSMHLGLAVAPPPGFTAFCRRSPLSCGSDVIEVVRAAAEADMMRSPFAIPIAAPASAAEPAPQISPDPMRTSDLRPLTPGRWRQLVTINTKINRALPPQSDAATWGTEDYWAIPSDVDASAGDCEDYVLEKRKALLKAGFAAASLNIALVSTPTGETHAVLLVATRDGEFVLDNLSPWVRPWHVTPYAWRTRQVNGEAFRWVAIG